MLPFSCRTKGWSDLLVSPGSCRMGWSWGRILRASLIHVLLDKSIRSAWISLSISPVHCHRAPWSLLSWKSPGKAGRELGWAGSQHGSSQAPSSTGELTQGWMGWGGTNQKKLVLFPSWEAPPPQIKQGLDGLTWNCQSSAPCIPHHGTEGLYNVPLLSQITSSIKRGRNQFICWHARPCFSFSCKMQSSK